MCQIFSILAPSIPSMYFRRRILKALGVPESGHIWACYCSLHYWGHHDMGSACSCVLYCLKLQSHIGCIFLHICWLSSVYSLLTLTVYNGKGFFSIIATISNTCPYQRSSTMKRMKEILYILRRSKCTLSLPGWCRCSCSTVQPFSHKRSFHLASLKTSPFFIIFVVTKISKSAHSCKICTRGLSKNFHFRIRIPSYMYAQEAPFSMTCMYTFITSMVERKIRLWT